MRECSEAAGSGMRITPLSSLQVVWNLLASDLDFHCLDFKLGDGNQKTLVPRPGNHSIHNPVHLKDQVKQLKPFFFL